MNTPEQTTARGAFTRLGFVLAAAGSAVGLGNIWKFPYITYENEGGTFVLVYLGAIFLVGGPIMLAEVLMGRHTGSSPVGAFIQLAKNRLGGRAWAAAGWLGIGSGFVILSYYSIVAGWTVYYFGKCTSWSLNGFTEANAAGLGDDFNAFLADGGTQLIFHALFMAATMLVVSLGVQRGIEGATRVLMPALLVILVALCADAVTAPGFGDALAFMFHLGPVRASGVLEAVGHAFFTLSLGMGAMLTYGSYLTKGDSIVRSSVIVCIFDTVIGLMACVIMFSIIFSVPEAERATSFSRSATILFTSLPRMFYGLPGGAVLAPAFYLLVAFAALTSTISLLEVVVAYFIDQRGMARRKAVLLVGGLIFALGIPSALALGANKWLSSVGRGGVFGTLDYLASNWMLPVGGLLTALFVGWIVPGEVSKRELEQGHAPVAWHSAWLWTLRVVSPLAIAWIIIEVLRGRSF